MARIPAGVEYDDSVGCHEIDAETTCEIVEFCERHSREVYDGEKEPGYA